MNYPIVRETMNYKCMRVVRYFRAMLKLNSHKDLSEYVRTL